MLFFHITRDKNTSIGTDDKTPVVIWVTYFLIDRMSWGSRVEYRVEVIDDLALSV